MEPGRPRNSAVPRSTTTPVDASGTPLPSGPRRSVPLESRIGSLMAPSMNMGWSYEPLLGAYLSSAQGKAPMMDPIMDISRNVCSSDVQAREATAANIMKPGGLLDSLLRTTPSTSMPTAAASTENFIAQLMNNTPPSNVGASLDGVNGNEKSVMVIFDGAFTHNMVLKGPFASANLLNLIPLVKITGSSMVDYPVCVDYKDGVTRFSEGWMEFVAAEKIVMGDMGLFVITSPNKLKMMLYDSMGLEKPMHKRPATWNLYVAYHEDITAPMPTTPVSSPMSTPMTSPLMSPTTTPAPTPTASNNNFICNTVPEHVRGMRYNLGPRLFMSEPLVERLAHVWINYRTDYPLYAARMIKSHLTTGIFYFSTSVSEMLPLMPKELTIYYANEHAGVNGKLKKRYGDGLARITKGWRTFIRVHSVEIDDVFVFCLRNTRAGLNLRVFPVAMV